MSKTSKSSKPKVAVTKKESAKKTVDKPAKSAKKK